MFGIFLLENIKKNKDFGVKFFEKGQILRHFSGLASSKMKILSKRLRVGYYIKKSFDTIFNMVMGREIRTGGVISAGEPVQGICIDREQ